MTDIYEKVATTVKSEDPVTTELLTTVDNSKAMAKYLSSSELNLDHWRKLILATYDANMNEMFQDVAQQILREEIDKRANSKGEDEEKRLILINAIAAYYLVQASKATEKSKRDELYGEIMKCTSKADTINMLHSSLFVLKGYYLFYQGTFDQAVNYFDNGRIHHPKRQCITAYIGQACVEFCKKDYGKALKLLKSAYRLNPHIPSKLKTALGYCFYYLNKTKLAQKAFESALEADEASSEATYGLAIVYKKKGNYTAYYENLEKAFNINNDNVGVLSELAEHFLFKEDFNKAKKLASYGLRLLNKSPTLLMEKSKLTSLKIDYYEIKSRFNYIIASCYHQTQNYENALKHYLHAVSLYSNNFLAQFGLGQIYINDRNWQEALSCFEHIVKNCTDTEIGECYRMLGYLYSKKTMKDEAIQYYEKAIKFDNKDYECMLEYASYLEGIDSDKALLLYLNAVKIIKSNNAQNTENGQKEIFIHPEILLNIAVLRHRKGEIDKAHDELKSLLETVEKYTAEPNSERLKTLPASKDTGPEKYKAMTLTIMYNLAIVLEEKGVIFEAINLYNKVIEENPLYVDAYMRLSCLLLNQGQKKRAEELCQTAIEKTDLVIKATKNERLRGKSVDGICLQGYTLQETGNLAKAIAAFSQVRGKYNLDDSYAKLSQAALYYYTSIDFRDKPPEQKRYLKSLVEISKSVLNTEEGNFFAAMTLGITLAETGRLSEAKDVFNILLESCHQNKNILLNMAQLEILNRRFDLAIATFNNYLKKAITSDLYTEGSLALCYFMTKRYKEAKRMYQKLILKDPENIAHRYNLGATFFEEAFEILKQENRQIQSTREGVRYLKIIQQQFDFLIGSNKNKIARSMREETPERQKMKEQETEKIRENASAKTYLISSNFDTFMDILRQDEMAEEKKDKIIKEKLAGKKAKEEKEKQKAREEALRKQRERELEEKHLSIMRQTEEAQEVLRQQRVQKESLKQKRSQKKEKEGGRRRKPKVEEEMENFIVGGGEDGDEEEAIIYEDDEEDKDYLYDDALGDEEQEAPAEEDEERQQRRSKNKEGKRRLKSLTKHRHRDEEEGDEDRDEAIQYEEDEEPKPEKKRKLVRNAQRRIINSDDEGQEETYGGDDNDNKDDQNEEGAMEEEANNEGDEERQSEAQGDQDNDNNEDANNGGEESGKRDDDEEEHYL